MAARARNAITAHEATHRCGHLEGFHGRILHFLQVNFGDLDLLGDRLSRWGDVDFGVCIGRSLWHGLSDLHGVCGLLGATAHECRRDARGARRRAERRAHGERRDVRDKKGQSGDAGQHFLYP